MDSRPPTWPTIYSLSLDFLVDNAYAYLRDFDRGTGRTTDTAVYHQRPSVPRHRSENLEQFDISEVTSSSCLRSVKIKKSENMPSSSVTFTVVNGRRGEKQITLNFNAL